MRKIKKLLMTLGLAGALAVGVGASVATLNESGPIKAEAAGPTTSSITMTDGVYDDTSSSFSWSSIPGIKMEQLQASSSTKVNSGYKSPARMYDGHIVSFKCDPGIKISEVKIHYPKDKGGYDLVAGYTIANDKVVSDAGVTISKGNTTKAGFHTFTTAGSEQLFIQNFYLKADPRDKKKEQLHISGVDITYSVDESSFVSTTKIEVTTLPTKTEYKDGDMLDLTGMVVTATMSDNTTKDITSDVSTTPAEGSNLGLSNTEVVVSYQELTAKFSITVKGIEISGEDRYLSPKSLSLVSAGGYAPNNTTKNSNGLLIKTNQVMLGSDGGIQIQKANGYITNVNATNKIDRILLINPKSIVVSAGLNNTDNTISGTTSENVATYDISTQNYNTFKISSPSGTGHVAMIIVEFDTPEANLAREAALAMNTALNNACAQLNVTTEIWNAIAADYAEGGKYSSLKTILKDVELTKLVGGEPTEIQKAISRYDYIISKYSHQDFLNRAPASLSQNVNVVSSTPYITIIVVISVLSITAIALFAISKRKKITQ